MLFFCLIFTVKLVKCARWCSRAGSQYAVQREAGGCFVVTKQLACAAPATVKRTSLSTQSLSHSHWSP